MPPAEVSIDAFLDLLSCEARATWRRVGQLAFQGLANTGGTCYVTAVVQVLLRVPAVALWLNAHAMHCEGNELLGDGSAVRCAACALWATRLQLGSAAVPELVRHRAVVGRRFEEHGQQDAAEFLYLLLKRMRSTELLAGRATEWRGVCSDDARATHVDRIFGYVEETRLLCKGCKSGKARYASANVLVLPVPPAEPQDRVWTVTDLYFLWAKPEERVGDDAVECSICGGQRTSHVQQRRVASRPNVLIVQVRRTVAHDSDVLRHRVLAEEEFSLPDVGAFELAGVVYHSGRNLTSGRCPCTSEI